MPGPGRPKGIPKTGGRQKGTPNKRTQLELDLVRKLGGNVIDLWSKVLSSSPIELAKLVGMKDESIDRFYFLRLQLDVAKDAAPYLLSKMPQRIAVGGDEELGPVAVAELTADQARKLILERLGQAGV